MSQKEGICRALGTVLLSQPKVTGQLSLRKGGKRWVLLEEVKPAKKKARPRTAPTRDIEPWRSQTHTN